MATSATAQIELSLSWGWAKADQQELLQSRSFGHVVWGLLTLLGRLHCWVGFFGCLNFHVDPYFWDFLVHPHLGGPHLGEFPIRSYLKVKSRS